MVVRAGREFLAIPGPTTMPDEVLRAMHRPALDIYSEQMVDLTDSLLRDLSKLFATKGQSYIHIANGHGAWEAVLSNVLSRGDKVLVLESGRFALNWGLAARAMGAEVEVLEGDWRRAVRPEQVEARLKKDDKEITQLFAGYLKEPHFPIRTSAIFALGTRGDASAIPALEAALNRDDLSIEMAPMIKSQIEHLKNSSAPGGAHGGAGSGSASSEKNPGDQRLVHLEQLVQEMNDRLKAIEGRLPPAAKPQGLR